MQHWPTLATILLLAIPASATIISEDVAGDAQWNSQDGALPALPLIGDSHVDLASLDVMEDAGGFWVRVQLHPPGPAQPATPGQITVNFRNGNASYQLAYVPATLYSLDSTTGQRRLIASLDEDSDLLTKFGAYVPRKDLLDEDGSPPFPGRILDGWSVTAQGAMVSLPEGRSISFQDSMPNAGTASPTFAVTLGSTGTDGARLFSSRPLRGSNGEATTFLYPVVAVNDASQPRTMELTVDSVPLGWTVSYEPKTFALQAGEQLAIPVIVSIPFRHSHGDTESFAMKMQNKDGPGSASLNLGVSYFEIPQPAGHHDTMTIHSGSSGQQRPTDPIVLDDSTIAFMNTLSEDTADTGQPIPGFVNGLVNSAFRWTIVMSPPLQMGLDFDLTRMGSISATFESTVPIMGGEMYGTLYLRRGETLTELANITPVPVEISANSQVTIESTVEGLPAADYILDEGQSIVFLLLYLDAGRPVTVERPGAVTLLPGSTFALPLHEYRDPIEAELLGATQASFKAITPLQRRANAGDSVAIRVELRNTSPIAIDPELELLGLNQQWASIVQQPKSGLAPGEAAEIVVAVHVPDDATPSELADFFIAARTGHGAPSLARILVDVDEATDHPDDAEYLAGLSGDVGRESPGPTALLLVLGLAFALAARRRYS